MLKRRLNLLSIGVAGALALISTSAAHATDSSVAAANQPPTDPYDGARPATEGFYPIWENTGFVEKHREMYLGTNGAHYGIMDVAQVGTDPVNFLYRAPNAYAKYSLYQQGRWHVAAQTGSYYLMDEASRSYLSPMYTSRLDNPDFSVILVPVTLTASYELSDWMQLHQTATMLGVFCTTGQIENEGFFGYSVVAELLAKAHHSVSFHVGEVGFWNHDFSMLGTSYRYHNSWLEFQLGYFYRFEQDGNQSAPMIALGFLI